MVYYYYQYTTYKPHLFLPSSWERGCSRTNSQFLPKPSSVIALVLALFFTDFLYSIYNTSASFSFFCALLFCSAAVRVPEQLNGNIRALRHRLVCYISRLWPNGARNYRMWLKIYSKRHDWGNFLCVLKNRAYIKRNWDEEWTLKKESKNNLYH